MSAWCNCQDVDINQVSDTVIGTTENIKDGNDEIREVSSRASVLSSRARVLTVSAGRCVSCDRRLAKILKRILHHTVEQCFSFMSPNFVVVS